MNTLRVIDASARPAVCISTRIRPAQGVCHDWMAGPAGFHNFNHRDRPHGIMTTAQLLASHLMSMRSLETDPRFAGRHYHQHPRMRRAAFFRDFRRFIPFEKRLEIYRGLRSRHLQRYGITTGAAA